jgi:hypothetical protein
MYCYSKSQFVSEIIDFAKALKEGQEISISFGRLYIVDYDYEDIVEYAKEYGENIEDMLYDLLLDNHTIQYYLCQYLPRY